MSYDRARISFGAAVHLTFDDTLRKIDAFVDTHFAESFIAYLVLHNENVDADSVAFALRHIEESREEFLKDHKDATSEGIDAVVNFLHNLQAMSAEFLDDFADWIDERRT